jgi:hypothetical protein
MNWSIFFSKLLSMIMSWIQAGNLRNQMYVLKDENEILRTALEDIARMDSDGRTGRHARYTLDRLNKNDRI